MDGKKPNRIESIIDRGAAAVFGGAVGFAAYVALSGFAGQPERTICTAAAAILANLICTRGLQAWAAAGPQFAVPAFAEIPLETTDELLLTEADRVYPELVLTDADRLPTAEEPLELDDILAELGPDSRVVRLFDPAKMPTPGQLSSRIDAHQAQSSAYPDASQQLSEALAELRRSLR